MNNIDVKLMDNKINIKYNGMLFNNNSQDLFIKYGYTNNWSNPNEEKMERREDGFEISFKILNLYNDINFCFHNEKEEWDNNDGCDYTFELNNIIQDEYSNKEKQIENGNLLKDNGTLLISEVKNKVFLPYTKEEVLKEIESCRNDYKTVDEVIEHVFTKPFDYYKYPVASRFKESITLITEREGMSLRDGITLGTELCKKRYLHPAIISACKNLDELNVYLDCLDKNELEDFRVFNIAYELHPVVVKQNNFLYEKTSIIQRIVSFIRKIFLKNENSI